MGKFIPGPQGSFENIVIGTKRRGAGNQQNQGGKKKYRKQCQQYVAGLAKIGFHDSFALCLGALVAIFPVYPG
jgi:hypothetical protein